MKRLLILSVLFCLLLLALGCSSSTEGVDPSINLPYGRIQGINIIPGILWIQPGVAYRFEARGLFPGGAIGDVTLLATWFSDDPTVAQMLGPGLVKALRPGLAKVHCTYDGVTSSTVSVAVPGVPLEAGIVPIHVEVFPGSVSVPIQESSVLSFVPTPATPAEMALPNPKPDTMFLLADASRHHPEGYWADSTLTITTGAGTGLEFDVVNNYVSPIDIDPLDPTHPLGPDWIQDNATVFILTDALGMVSDWGVMSGDGYTLSKRWIRFTAVADYSDGSKADVTAASNWHLSDPNFGIITSGGYFNNTAATSSNLVVYAEFQGLISNYVPISVY